MIKIILSQILFLISITISYAQIQDLEVKRNSIDLTNISTKTGNEGSNSLHFGGIDDYVSLNSISSKMNALGDNFTIEFWTNYLQADNSQNYGVIFSANASNGANRFLIRASGGTEGTDGVVVYINEAGTNQYIIGDTAVGDGRCHHIAFTYDNGLCCIYVDGMLDICSSYNIDFLSGDMFSFGQEYDLGPVTSAFFKGEIDDFRVWDVTRTVTEINDNMNLELSGSETNLIVYYNFNQGTASGDNTSINQLNNQADAADFGILNGFSLNGSTSNFIKGNCKGSASFTDYKEDDNQIISYFNDANILTISGKKEWNHITTYVYDMKGQLCLKNAFKNTSLGQINISELNSGMYVVKVIGDNYSGSFKIVK